jgi:hypothetical protein
MAIQITYKSSIYSTSAGNLTCSPTWTPATNALVVAFVVTTYASSPVDPTGVTGHGLTYSAMTLGTSTLSTTHKLSGWVAKTGASPTSVACVATVSGTTTGGAVIEFLVTGADVSGTALQALQDTTATNTGTSATPTVTLAGATDALNRAMTFVVVLANSSPIASGNWILTTGAAGNFASPSTGAASLFENNQFDTAGAAISANANWRMVGIEIKASKTITFNTEPKKAGIGAIEVYGSGVLL